MESRIVDVPVMSKMFEVFAPGPLMLWGISGWSTISVEVLHLKRVFHMEKIVTKHPGGKILHFGPDQKDLGSVLVFDFNNVLSGDRVTIHYTITATIDGGPGSVQIRDSKGLALRINLYATAT